MVSNNEESLRTKWVQIDGKSRRVVLVLCWSLTHSIRDLYRTLVGGGCEHPMNFWVVRPRRQRRSRNSDHLSWRSGGAGADEVVMLIPACDGLMVHHR